MQSNLYSFSFAPNPDWPRSYSEQPEIQAYLQATADRFDVRRHCVFGADVTVRAVGRRRPALAGARPRPASSAPGAGLRRRRPGRPDLSRHPRPGLLRRHGHALRPLGRRARPAPASGSPSSAPAPRRSRWCPAIQPIVDSVAVYQRTPAWVVPRTDHPVKPLMRAALPVRPGLQKARPRARSTCSASSSSSAWPSAAASSSRSASWPGRTCTSQVRDPKLREALTPDYTIGCKRILISNDYFPAVAAPNAELVTAGIAEVRPHSIVDRDGVERPDRHDRAGHRLPRHRPADRREDLRPRRAQPRRGLGRRHGQQPQQPPSPASRTCSCWSGPTSGSGTRRWST